MPNSTGSSTLCFSQLLTVQVGHCYFVVNSSSRELGSSSVSFASLFPVADAIIVMFFAFFYVSSPKWSRKGVTVVVNPVFLWYEMIRRMYSRYYGNVVFGVSVVLCRTRKSHRLPLLKSSLLGQSFEYCYAFFRQERNEVRLLTWLPCGFNGSRIWLILNQCVKAYKYVHVHNLHHACLRDNGNTNG